MEELKKCSKCERELPLTPEYFFKNRYEKYGFQQKCKECQGYKFIIRKISLTNELGLKTCVCCNKELPATGEYFDKSKNSKDGLRQPCKECRGSSYGLNNFCYKHGVEKIWLINKKRPHYQCALCKKEKTKEYYYKKHPPKDKKPPQTKEERRTYKREYVRRKRATDARFNLETKMGNMIYGALRKNKEGVKWTELVGYTLDQLHDRLMETMPYGYTWGDVLSGRLHIDHIIPKSLFTYTDPSQKAFKDCWALSNLQLLPSEVNIAKFNHYDKPFQFYLPI